MKLLIVASMSQISTANYFVAAFKRAGHELLLCSDIDGPDVNVVAHGLVDVGALTRRRDFAADALLFFEGGSMRLLPDIRTADCLTAWYAIDTHMDFEKHVLIGRLFDASFVAQKQYVEDLSLRGVTNAQWLPLAFAPELMQTVQPARDIDIAYVGSENAAMHPERSALLGALQRNFDSTSFGRAIPERMASIYASAKLVFNRTINNDINMRFFEAMGAGAVLVTDRVVDNGVEELFDENLHYVTYGNEAELLETARKLLADPTRLRDIGNAAQSHIMSFHTYQHRADKIISQLKFAVREANPGAQDIFAACLRLGLMEDALRTAATAMGSVGGGRLQRIVGLAAKGWILSAAVVVASLERLRRLFRIGSRA